MWLCSASGLGLLLGGCAVLAWPESAVLLESTPPGAEVTLDGQPAGRTPLRLASRPWPLQAQLLVSRAGYRSWSGPLTSGIGETKTVEVPLEPLPATISVNSTPRGALVQVDGHDAGQTPLSVPNLAPTRHELTLRLNGYVPWHARLELEPGGTASREAQLETAAADRDAEAESRPGDVDPAASGLYPPNGAQAPAAAGGAADQFTPREVAWPNYPLAVMVENSADARPQSGLASADVVFEAMAEGGISRFMAVYIDGEAAVVGPVRSARHYFVNLAAEFGASLVHVGSSPAGYISLTWYGTPSLDDTFGQPGFWRSRARYAPHNAYTSVAGARQALEGRAGNGTWAGFNFKDPERPYHGPPAPVVSLDYAPWGYRVEYRYDPIENRYLRFMAGGPHVDAESRAQLWARNVVVLQLNTWVMDAQNRLDMTQVGSGPAVYFVDGVAIEGDWTKARTRGITRFLDKQGNPVEFNPGPIWVQLISPEGAVAF